MTSPVAQYDTVMRDAFMSARVSPGSSPRLVRVVADKLLAGRGRIKRKRMWAVQR